MLRKLIQASLAHPITVTVAVIGVLVLGGLALGSIPVDILPVNRSPAVQVLTFYGGMPADTIDKNITSRLERQTGQASGRTRQESRSIQGASIVRNYFGSDVDPSGALTQVNSLATAAYKSMPPGTDPPIILPFDPTGTTPVCVVALDSQTQSESTLYDVGRYEVRNMLMGMPGANAPAVHGGKLRAVMAYIDRHKLAARGLSPLDVMNAIEQYNVFLPTGSAQFGETDYAIGSNSLYDVIESMGDIPLRSESGNATYLRDVATPEDASLTQTSLVRVDGRRQVYIPVYRQPGASTLGVVDHIKSSIDSMTSRLTRDGIDLKVVMDQSVYVRQAIKSLVEEGILGAVMCSLVILIFLGDVRMTGIASLTIPVSVTAAVGGLYATGNTINVMTLAGLALAIGPLVDLAVISLENTHRHLMRGASPQDAALNGTAEVATPAFVATCCTLLVLAPLAFLPDLGEFLFRPMALAVAFAMLAAFALSQTFVPSRCAAWLKPHHSEDITDLSPTTQQPLRYSNTHDGSGPPRSAGRRGRRSVMILYSLLPTSHLAALAERIEKALYRLSRFYERVLDGILGYRRLVVLGSVGLLAATLLILGPQLRREFFPEVDGGAFEMTVRAPSGTRLELTEERVADIEQVIRDTLGSDLQLVVAEVGVVADWSAAYTPNAGPMDAALKVQLTADRENSAQEHVRRLRRKFAADRRFADLEFGFDAGGLIRAAMNGGKATPITVRITGKDTAALREVAEAVRKEAAQIDGIVDARILQRLDYPQYVIDVDRTKAADLGLPLKDVMKNVVAALNGSTQFNKSNFYIDPVSKGQYYVGVQYSAGDIESIQTVLNVPITSRSQKQAIPLRNLVTIRQSTIATDIVHNNLQSGVELVMSVDGRDLGHVADDLIEVLHRFGDRQADGTWLPYAIASSPEAHRLAGQTAAHRETLKGARILLSGEYARMQDMFRNLGGGLALATVLVYLLLTVLFQSFRLPLIILFAVPIGLVGVVLMLYATGTAVNVQSLLGVIFMVGIVVANTVLLVDCAQTFRTQDGMSPTEAIRTAAAIRMRPILMTALAALLALLPMALALGRGSEANAPLGRAVIGGLIAGVLTTLLVVPCLYAWMTRAESQPEPATP